MEKTYTKQEVIEILEEVYEYYDIHSLDKFQMKHLSNFQDAPDWEVVSEKEKEDIESFIL